MITTTLFPAGTDKGFSKAFKKFGTIMEPVANEPS
jgi:hypothetical protein